MCKINTKNKYNFFSISTTIRNPYRNEGYLRAIDAFIVETTTDKVWLDINSDSLDNLYKYFIKVGCYRPLKVSESILFKWNNSIILNEEEVIEVIKNNPQKIDELGKGSERTKTIINALLFQNLVFIDKINNRFRLSILGKDLLDNSISIEDTYIKAFSTIHFGGIYRNKTLNKCNPFVNLINILDLYNKNYNKKLSKYQFILIMGSKNNNTFEIFEEIKLLKDMDLDKQKDFIENKMLSENYKNLKEQTLFKDYLDELYRKFSMTGLFNINIQKYISFKESEISKVNLLINKYKNNVYKDFTNFEDYCNYVENYKLPWEIDLTDKEKVLIDKAKKYEIEILDKNLLDIEKEVNQFENIDNFKNIALKIDLNYCFDYLKKILNYNYKPKIKCDVNLEESTIKYIKDFTILEWFVAIILFRKSKDYFVIPGCKFDANGYPISHASGGKSDIVVKNNDIYGSIELTLIKSSKQQENNETTSIANHLLENIDSEKGFCLLLAPIIHKNVLSYLNYITSINDKVILTASPIMRFLNLLFKDEKDKKISLNDLYILVIKEYESYKDKDWNTLSEILSEKNYENYIE